MKCLKAMCQLTLAIALVACSSSKNSEEVMSEDLKTRLDRLYSNDQFREAIMVLNQMIPQDTLNGELYYKRGFSYAQVFEYDSSEVDFKKSVDLKYRIVDSYYNLALVHVATMDDSLAIAYLKRALSIDPELREARDMLVELENK